jgi:hypothetical protein
VSIDPAGEEQEEEDERGRQRVHRGSLPERRPRFNGCEIGHPAPSRWAESPEANVPPTASIGQCSLRSAFGRDIAACGLDAIRSQVTPFHLPEANEALRALEHGEIHGAAVLRMGESESRTGLQ